MNIYFHGLFAFFIRVGCIFYSRLQDAYSEVKYTDIDYRIFTEAANYVWNGESPFKRPTYRYSPILAFLLTPNIFMTKEFGKLLFSALDIVTSFLIYYIQRKYTSDIELCKKCVFLWLYNPLTIVISTRGSSESVMTTLIMLSVLLFINDKILAFGLVYGFAVHMKIYPCIYALTFYFVLSNIRKDLKGWEKLKMLLYPDKPKIILIFASAVGFALPTLGSIYLYGFEYLDEALIYHLRRKDLKHNFSPYFYLLYLSEAVSPRFSSLISISSFLIQIILLSAVAWKFYKPQTLTPCLFIETFIFVTFNKVCTSQYFLWYLCLFPLCYPLVINYHKYVFASFFLWFLGQGLWLAAAYCLEFKGMNTFIWIHTASLVFFLINIFLIGLFTKLVINSKQTTKNVKED